MYTERNVNTAQISNQRIANHMGSYTGASSCFLKQETLHSLLSTYWFQELFQECFFELIAF